MAANSHEDPARLPEGIFSLLDTDLYKLTMQCCILKYFPGVEVTYNFTNRTHDMKFTRAAYSWLQSQIEKLGNIRVASAEIEYLRRTCNYFSEAYLGYMSTFQLQPAKQIEMLFHPVNDTGGNDDVGDVELHIRGLWVETILYEIPILALTSEAYFKFCDRDWNHDGQVDKARRKGLTLLENGCILSEFGSRRRRDYHTQELVLEGLLQARKEAEEKGWQGKLTGTSNVHFAMRFGLVPVGTVAHEWFMGIAAVTDNYEDANETALRYWVGTFGVGVLGIALTDTFGTPAFLRAFRKPVPLYTTAEVGSRATTPSAVADSDIGSTGSLSDTKPPLHAPISDERMAEAEVPSYAKVFSGTRQDSGDPEGFVKLMREFYDREGIHEKKVIVFSDSLNIDLCLKYKAVAESAGFQPTFGVGTFLTNDFVRVSTGKKSVPLNIVIKIASAAGRPAVKISDNVGKNTGDAATVAKVKRILGYEEREWEGGDERTRWGTEEDQSSFATSINR